MRKTKLENLKNQKSKIKNKKNGNKRAKNFGLIDCNREKKVPPSIVGHCQHLEFGFGFFFCLISKIVIIFFLLSRFIYLKVFLLDGSVEMTSLRTYGNIHDPIYKVRWPDLFDGISRTSLINFNFSSCV